MTSKLSKTLLGGTAKAVLVAAAIGAAGFIQVAQATPIELQLTTSTATSGVIVGTTTASGSAVTFNGVVGAWTINLTSGSSSGPGFASMDLSSIDATAAAAAPDLHVYVSDTGFNPAALLFEAKGTGHIVSGTGTAAVSYYVDAANAYNLTAAAVAGATALGSEGPFSTTYGFDTTTAGSGGASPYSLTEVLTLHASANGVKWSTDSSITQVPEPMSLTLFGSALVGLGAVRRRRKQKA